MTPPAKTSVVRLRHARHRQRARRLSLLVALLLAGVAATLMLGQSFIPLPTVLRVMAGDDVPGATFTVMELRLPRAAIALLAGGALGLGGAAFQSMLRNPLASPDIIGISAGASTAAVFAIVVLSLRGAPVSLLAVVAALGVALLIYALSWRKGITGARLILIGIGVAAMLQSLTAYLLTQAPGWPLQEALRWMTGSLNSVRLAQALPLAAVLALAGGILLHFRHDLEVMRMGDDTATGLGVRLSRVRLCVMVAAVALVASATAVTGPVAFVAFLSGPVAARLFRHNGSMLLPAAMTGALMMLGADFAGQFLLPSRYPVGVVTGMVGAPWLLVLLIRENRRGATQ